MKKSLIIAPLALLASACTTTQSAQAPAAAPQSTSAEFIAAAEVAKGKAAAVGYEWRDTGKLIEAAKKAAAAKDDDKAISLAQLALRQSQNAIKQQAAQKDAASRY